MSVVIPTRFERPSLAALIAAAREVCPVVLVHTEPGHADVEGVANVHDYRRNIQHWWNTGLDACEGPTLVLNDDLEATPDALQTLLTVLEDVDLVYVPGRNKSAVTPISGWCFGLHPDRLRPDPAFTFWYGDDDVWMRATEDGYAVCVPVDVTHIDRGGFGCPPEFAEAVRRDKALFEGRWG